MMHAVAYYPPPSLSHSNIAGSNPSTIPHSEPPARAHSTQVAGTRDGIWRQGCCSHASCNTWQEFGEDWGRAMVMRILSVSGVCCSATCVHVTCAHSYSPSSLFLYACCRRRQQLLCPLPCPAHTAAALSLEQTARSCGSSLQVGEASIHVRWQLSGKEQQAGTYGSSSFT
jgi:hypothetical protein